MDEYIQVFGWTVLIVDICLLLVMLWCVYCNFSKLYHHDYTAKDISFRTIMMVMSIVYVLANLEAFKRHFNIFWTHTSDSTITRDTVESLLSDRGYMLVTAIFMLFLTRKYLPAWFK